MEDPLGEQPKIFEEPIEGEEEGEPISTDLMAENRNDRGDRERIEDAFPIRETDGDTKMTKISPFSLPHFHGPTLYDPNNFLFEFAIICRTYDYTTDDQKLKLFPSTLKDAARAGSGVYSRIASQPGLRCSKPSTTSIETIASPKTLKRKFL